MLFYSHCIWGLELDAFLGDTGWNNRGVVQALQADSFSYSFWWYVPQSWMLSVHVLCLAIVFCFFVGLFTRVTSVASWIIAVSYAQRAMLSNYGLDQILCCLVLYLCVAPCGQCLSLDALWKFRKSKKPLKVIKTSSSTVSMRLIQIHLCIMYFFAGTSKLQGESWWNGSAVWETIANFEYQSFDLTFLAAFPIVTQIATHMTVLWELSFAALVWNRKLRPFVLLIGISMHFGIGMFLGMWTFGLTMMFGYSTLIASSTWRKVIHGWLKIPAMSISESLEVTNVEADQSESQTMADQAFNASTLDLERAAMSESQIGFILVSRSQKQIAALSHYVSRYGLSNQYVDGMTQAIALSHLPGQQAVVVLNTQMNRVDMLHWATRLREVAPFSCLVFTSGRPEDHGPITDRCTCIEHRGARAVRLAVEDILNRKLSVREPMASEPVSSDLQPPNEPTSPRLFNAAESTPMRTTDQTNSLSDDAVSTESELLETAPAKTGNSTKNGRSSLTLSLLLVCALMAGCGESIDEQSLINRARILNDRSRFDEALSILNQVKEMNPGSTDACYLEGVALEQMGDLEKALEAYTNCLAIDENHPDSLNNRGVVNGRLGNIPEAIGDLQKAVEVNSEDALAWSNLALAYHEQGDFGKAIENYSNALNRDAAAQTYFQRGNAFLAADRLPEAIKDYSSAIEKKNSDTKSYLNRAVARFRTGNYIEAEGDLQQAIKYDTDMVITPIAQNIRDSYQHKTVQARAHHLVLDWIEASGWETTNKSESVFSFSASRVPTVGDDQPQQDPNVPSDFLGVVLCRNPDGEILGDYQEVQRLISDTSPKCLFVVDAGELNRFSIDAVTQQPFWLFHADYDWKPTSKDFRAHQVRLELSAPETSTAKR